MNQFKTDLNNVLRFCGIQSTKDSWELVLVEPQTKSETEEISEQSKFKSYLGERYGFRRYDDSMRSDL